MFENPYLDSIKKKLKCPTIITLKVHWTFIVRFIEDFESRHKKRAVKTALFKILFRKRGITFSFTSSLSIVLSNIIEFGTSSYIWFSSKQNSKL